MDSRSGEDRVSPPLDMPIFIHRQEFGCAIEPAFHKSAVPGETGNISDRIFAACQMFIVGQSPVQYVEQAFRFHGKTVDSVFNPGGCISVEVPKAASDIGRAAHLPE